MNDFIKAIVAGLMIGIAGTIYLVIPINWVGAILFAIGLTIICLRGYNLYTGKIGYIKSFKDLKQIAIYILGNLIGVWLISIITQVSATELINNKLQIPGGLLLLKSIGCGMLMYIAVDEFKIHNKSLIGIICCVPAFILVGFEHSIADLFYLCCSGIFNLRVILFILIIIVGNAIGALAHNLIIERK